MRQLTALILIATLIAPSISLAATTTPIKDIRQDRMELRKENMEERRDSMMEKRDDLKGKIDMMKDKRASSTPSGENFCANLEKYASRITDSVPKREGKRDEKRDDRKGKMDDRRASTTAKLDDKRLDWDDNREERYAKMLARASTTEQKAAIEAFKASVDAAVATRRAAIDAAIATFRTSVDALVAEREAQVTGAFTALKSATDAAVAKAKADCAAGTDGKQVRETLKTELKAAQETFRAAVKPNGAYEGKMRELTAARFAAIKTAIDTFKGSFDAALSTLKAALGIS